jgi:integrase
LSAKWEQFDLEAGIWVKPSSATKQGKLHRVPLSTSAVELLRELRTKSDEEDRRRAEDKLPPLPWVFPGTDGQPLTTIMKLWRAVCRKAGLNDVRPHDLRHSYAAVLASEGHSLPIIGALLGHTQAATTQRYAHLMDDPLRAATERAGQFIKHAVKDTGN